MQQTLAPLFSFLRYPAFITVAGSLLSIVYTAFSWHIVEKSTHRHRRLVVNLIARLLQPIRHVLRIF